MGTVLEKKSHWIRLECGGKFERIVEKMQYEGSQIFWKWNRMNQRLYEKHFDRCGKCLPKGDPRAS